MLVAVGVARAEAWEDPATATEGNMAARQRAYAEREHTQPLLALLRMLEADSGGSGATAALTAALKAEAAAARAPLALLAHLPAVVGQAHPHAGRIADAARALRLTRQACDDLVHDLADVLPPVPDRPWAVDAATVPERLAKGEALLPLWPRALAAVGAASRDALRVRASPARRAVSTLELTAHARV
jgi:hypothetical protein